MKSKRLYLNRRVDQMRKLLNVQDFFGLQTHEIQAARDGERSSKITLRVILGEPIVTMEDQYNLFRVTSLVISSSGVWLVLLHSLRHEKDH